MAKQYFSVTFLGHDGQGACLCDGVREGDNVVFVARVGNQSDPETAVQLAAGNATASFASTIADDDQLEQIAPDGFQNLMFIASIEREIS